MQHNLRLPFSWQRYVLALKDGLLMLITLAAERRSPNATGLQEYRTQEEHQQNSRVCSRTLIHTNTYTNFSTRQRTK